MKTKINRKHLSAGTAIFLTVGCGFLLLSGCTSRQNSQLYYETMEHITSKDGTVIGYQRSGSGPPLLLVHGTTADHRRWATVSSSLEQYFTVYAMDRRGRGISKDAQSYSIVQEFEDVAAIVDAIDEPVYILGHSYGGLCALEAAVLTGNVRGLILYEPPIPVGMSLYPSGTPERMQALIDEGELEAALEVFFREIVKMPEYELEAYRKLPMWKGRIQLAPTIPREIMFEQSYTFDPEKFQGLQVPTLLLLGGDSPLLFQKAIETLDAALPNSQTVVLPGQQHIAMDTNPELFVKEVRNFLNERVF